MDRLKLLQNPLPIDGFSDVWSKVTKIIGKRRIKKIAAFITGRGGEV